MTVSLTLVIVGAVLVSCGFFLILERSIMRILAGIVIASNGINVLFVAASGQPGGAPIINGDSQETMSDPLPQAMMLTAIVITLAVSAFMLALSYRSVQLDGHDEVPDDVEDAIIRRRAEADLASESFDDSGDDNDSTPADTEEGGLSTGSIPVVSRKVDIEEGEGKEAEDAVVEANSGVPRGKEEQ
ncbi:Na(+)/H(+) antiporter subunit C [Humidisolicoccus flavus]|uniref:Na(+)/H(+) antiporter subunit C n=1 Tax=Humidisolicoccus flavus TaxID=3111414 RepID=UPI003255AF01